MYIYLIFIKLLFFTIQHDFSLLIDKIFKSNYDIDDIVMYDCKQNDKDSFYYRERPTNIKDIINSTKLKKYKSVYIPELKYENNVSLFPKSTIFFVPYYFYIRVDLNKYCVIYIRNELEKYNSYYYIIIGKKSYLSDISDYEIIPIYSKILILYSIYFAIISIKFVCCTCQNILIFLVSFFNIFMGTIHILFFFGIKTNFLPFIFYSLSKAFFYVNLIFFVSGFEILNYESPYGCHYGKFLLILLIFDSIITFLFLYLIYFIPSLNNFYLFSLKNFIYYIYLLIITIKSMKNKLIRLYRQYKFEQIQHSFFVIGYKAKLIIYIKLLIFSLLYSLSNIILPIFQYIYIIEYTEAFFFNHYINVIGEIIFGVLFSALFFPKKMTVFFCLPVVFDYNYRRIITLIGKENRRINNISNLTKKALKKKHLKEKIPIVLIKPYDNIDYSYDYLKLGTVEKKNNLF